MSSEDRFEAFRAAGNALVADHVAAEVVVRFADHGISSVLLRGPTIARHLYGKNETREYVDADLLVQPSARESAEQLLRDLGFSHHAVLGQSSVDRPRWASTWVRAHDGANVDLHWTIAGAGAPPEAVWTALSEDVDAVELFDVTVQSLRADGTALIVALHAAHHGVQVTHTLRDLERALERFPLSTWERASELAEATGAVPAFAAGLRLLPAGDEVARRLSLPDLATPETLLRAGTAPPMALGFDWLARTPGFKRKARLVAAKIVPDRQFMRGWSPLARSGTRSGLVLAYAWRPFWLLRHSIPGLRAWLAARRRTDQ
jgi:hypothetical protein